MSDNKQSEIIHQTEALRPRGQNSFRGKPGLLTLYQDKLSFQSIIDPSLNEEILLSNIDHILMDRLAGEHWIHIYKTDQTESKVALFTNHLQLFSPMHVARFPKQRQAWIKAFEQKGIVVRQSMLLPSKVKSSRQVSIVYIALFVVTALVAIGVTLLLASV